MGTYVSNTYISLCCSIVEIYGPESSGKTTLALHAIAESQRIGGTAAFIDAEHALDPVYAGNLGVNIDELLVSQPDSGEMALDVVDQLVRSSAVDVIVIDSVAALVPRVELEGDMSDSQIGLQARLMSKAMRKITGSLALSQCTVIFLNQLRSKVGVIYGSPEVTSGGNALKFYASVRYVFCNKSCFSAPVMVMLFWKQPSHSFSSKIDNTASILAVRRSFPTIPAFA
jgi:recombination protein RecA